MRISMYGKDQLSGNIFVKRLWRAVKYNEVYLKRYGEGSEAIAGIGSYFPFYDNEQPHQALTYLMPEEVHFNRGGELGLN